jgi:5-hydroxyisourate hydrolase
MSQLTTHVLDISTGTPATDLTVMLEQKTASGWQKTGGGITDRDGRIRDLLSADAKLANGIYRLIFDTHAYFTAKQVKSFYHQICVEFEITDGTHYHVPLLLSPYGYSTYRGS